MLKGDPRTGWTAGSAPPRLRLRDKQCFEPPLFSNHLSRAEHGLPPSPSAPPSDCLVKIIASKPPRLQSHSRPTSARPAKHKSGRLKALINMPYLPSARPARSVSRKYALRGEFHIISAPPRQPRPPPVPRTPPSTRTFPSIRWKTGRAVGQSGRPPENGSSPPF